MLLPDHNSAPHATTVSPAVTEMLVRRLTGSFGIPTEDAVRIVRDARVTLLGILHVSDPETLLLEIACDTARAYWRSALPDATPAETRALEEIAFTGAALASLAPRVREALRLRFHDRRTYAEIAAELDVVPAYARRMVWRALARIARAQREASR